MLDKYLLFRFKSNNHNRYHRYYDEWLSGITEEQLDYFEKEMFNLIKQGKYDPEK